MWSVTIKRKEKNFIKNPQKDAKRPLDISRSNKQANKRTLLVGLFFQWKLILCWKFFHEWVIEMYL